MNADPMLALGPLFFETSPPRSLPAPKPNRLMKITVRNKILGALAGLEPCNQTGQALLWNAEWRLDWKGQSQPGRHSAVTFDEAFRQGLGDAAKVMKENQRLR